MNVHTFQHEDRTFNYTDRPFTVPASATAHMLALLSQWQRHFRPENTHVSREWSVPSLIVRFDGVLTPEGTFDAYEIQSGCGWVGYSSLVNPAVLESREYMRAYAWPPFSLLAPEGKLNHPDELLWLPRIGLEEAIANETLLWVRYSAKKLPRGDVREAIISRSLKPVRSHNDKHYGTQMGWWKEVAAPEELPWDTPFALKPVRGFGSRDIMLWLPHTRQGRATRTQIEATLARRGSMFLQSFIPPMQMEVAGESYNVILRPFFGYHPAEKRWVPMHGVWTGRPHPSLRIHGASDTISGPLYLET